MTSDPSRGAREGPSDDVDPADRHSGEGLASMRPRLARTLADSATRTASRQPDAMTTCTSPQAPPESDTPGASTPSPNEKSPAATLRG